MTALHDASTKIGTQRLVIQSLGESEAGIIAVLRNLLPQPDADIAALVYRAPSILLDGINQSFGDEVVQLLSRVGLETTVVGQDEEFCPGVGNFEIALVVSPDTDISAVIDEVGRLLGVNEQIAQRIVCASPARLISNVSTASVEAIRRRMARHGAEIDVSEFRKASYDLFVLSGEAHHREVARQILATAGIRYIETEGQQAAVVASELCEDQAQNMWDKLRGMGVTVHVLNRDFQRFDVSLLRVEDPPGMAKWLAADIGMPEQVAEKVVQRLPVVIEQNVGLPRTQFLLESIVSRNGQATVLPRAFQSFSLEVLSAPDLVATATVIERIGDVPVEKTLSQLARPPARVVDSLTPTRAQWLRQQLKKTGAQTRLVPN